MKNSHKLLVILLYNILHLQIWATSSCCACQSLANTVHTNTTHNLYTFVLFSTTRFSHTY